MIDSTYEDKLYQTPTFAGAVRKLQTNELRNTVMLRLLRVNRLCSRTVSGTANRLKKHGRRNPLPFPFSQRSHVDNLRQTIQGKGVIHKRVETAGVYPLVRPRGVSARSRAPQSATLRLIQAKNLPPIRGEHANAVRVPHSAGAEKDCRPDRANTLTQFEYPAQPVQRKRLPPVRANPPTRFVFPAPLCADKRTQKRHPNGCLFDSR